MEAPGAAAAEQDDVGRALALRDSLRIDRMRLQRGPQCPGQRIDHRRRVRRFGAVVQRPRLLHNGNKTLAT